MNTLGEGARARLAQRLATTRFATDDGSAPAALAAALARPLTDPDRADTIWGALRGGRLLVPVSPHPHPGRTTDGTVSPHGNFANPDPCAEAALRAVTVPDGRRALPVFSSVATLHTWDSTARPLPVEAERAATAAIALTDSLLVIDPAGPHPGLVRRPAVVALATGHPWRAPWQDPDIVARVAALAVGPIIAVSTKPGQETEVRIVVSLASGLPPADRENTVRALTERLGAIVGGCDSVEIVPVRTVTPRAGEPPAIMGH